MSTVMTIGTFDCIHVGHLELLAECRRLAGASGRVVVSVNDDAFVERFKGRRTVNPQDHRMAMLRALRDVDHVVANTGGEHASFTIDRVGPDVLAVGDDWQGKDYVEGQLRISQSWLDSRGIRLVYVSRTTGESTTAIRERMAGAA